MDLLIPVLAFALVMGVISWAGYQRFGKAGRMMQQLGKPVLAASTIVIQQPVSAEPAGVVRLIRNIGEQVPINFDDPSVTKRDLVGAGFRGDNAIAVYSGIRICLAALLFVVMLLARNSITDNPVLRIVLLLAGPFGGYFIPSFYLESLVKKRHEKLRLSLPDALDLMVVSIEAGLGLDQAIQYVARELQGTHSELAEELQLISLEMRAGKRRSEALKNFAERAGEEEIRKLVAILVQNDRFGTSMGDSLRSHSDFMRVRRRQDAEERAGKVGVKLVFPIFLFILPSMLVVAAGPGLLQVFKHLFPMMKSFGH